MAPRPTHILLAAVLALAAAAAAIHVPSLHGAAAGTVTIEVRGLDRLVPGASHLYGWAVAWGTAPAAELRATAQIKPGTDTLRISFPAGKLIEESRKNLEALGSLRSRLHEASALTITLYLYDDKGHHYIASALIGSYELALRETGNPQRAYQLVKNDPYYIYHHQVIELGPRDFTVVNATPTLDYISKRFYTHPAHAETAPPEKPPPRPQDYWFTCYDVITIDNYWSYHQNYGLELDDSDFIVLPELYYAQMPQGFSSRVSGADPHQLYNRLKHIYGTAVYVPASCMEPLVFAVNQWYHVSPGLHRLEDFLSELAGHHVDWRDVKQPNTFEWLDSMPILRLTGSCGSNCDTTRPKIALSIAYTHYNYYESGISVLGLITLGEEHEILNVDTAPASITPIEAKQGAVTYITASILRKWLGDAVHVDYRISEVLIHSSRDGRWYHFWRIEPVLAFTPLHDDQLLSLDAIELTPEDGSIYTNYLNKFQEMLGYTALTAKTIYDKQVSWLDNAPEVIDTTVSSSYGSDELTGAVYGVASDALMSIVASIAGKASRLAGKLLDIAGIFVSYAYANREAQATAIKLERQSSPSMWKTVHVVVKRYEQFIATNTYEYKHNTALVNPEPPLAMTYYVEFNPTSHGPPNPPPNPPTKRSHEG